MKIEDIIKSNRMSLETKTLINLAYTSRVLEEMTSCVFKNFDLTSQQFNVLRILRGQQGNPANLSTVQDRMVDRSSNTTRLVDKLIKKKLVNRRICPDNRRKVEIFITDSGLELLDKIDPLLIEKNNKILQNLEDTEKIQLNNLLDKLRADE